MLTWLNAPHTQSRLDVISYVEEEKRVFEDVFEVFWDFFFVNSEDISHAETSDVIWQKFNASCVKGESELTFPSGLYTVWDAIIKRFNKVPVYRLP